MIKIGKSYYRHRKLCSRLCADITVDKRKITLWFSMENAHTDYLRSGYSDAFVMAMLPTALREGHEIICEDPISARLHYQLTCYLIPALVLSADNLHLIRIVAPLRSQNRKNYGAVGTIFSNNTDSIYTIIRHDGESEYPLTHLAIFNLGSSGNAQKGNTFLNNCRHAKQLAKKQNLQTVCIDTNFDEVFSEKYDEVYSFRIVSCALALQGLFSVYLLSAKYDAGHFQLNTKEAARYELLTVSCISTESLSFYLSGSEVKYWKKPLAITQRKLSSYWMKYSNLSNMYNRKNIIQIGKPYIEKSSNEIRLCANVKIHKKEHIMFFSVNESYGKYLTEDRADAFIAALLTPAMRESANIVCDAPITRRLLYQLNHYLIPMMSSNMKEYHPITIYASPTDTVLECAGAVGTGWTGGVDSMFTYMQNCQMDNPVYKLTHLLITNNGAIEGEHASDTLKRMVDKTVHGFAAETELDVVGVNTNIQEILNEHFIAVSDTRHASVILALQKLFRIYMVSSSYGFFDFSFRAQNMAYYEMAVLNSFETDNTVIYSCGGVFSRLQKLQELSNYSMAHKYLHPCIYALRDNCGKCGKCIRIEVALYALGTLNRFADVYDVKTFEENKDWYLDTFMSQKEQTTMRRDVLKLLQQPNPHKI